MTRCLDSPRVKRLGTAGETFRIPAFLDGLSIEPRDSKKLLPTPLNRPPDAQLAHARLQRGALHAQEDGGALGTGDAPLRLLQGA